MAKKLAVKEVGVLAPEQPKTSLSLELEVEIKGIMEPSNSRMYIFLRILENPKRLIGDPRKKGICGNISVYFSC